jgi:hypothetical protein
LTGRENLLIFLFDIENLFIAIGIVYFKEIIISYTVYLSIIIYVMCIVDINAVVFILLVWSDKNNEFI